VPLPLKNPHEQIRHDIICIVSGWKAEFSTFSPTSGRSKIEAG
jgi:hypothetical protein